MKKYEDYKIKITNDEIYWPPVTIQPEYVEWSNARKSEYKDGKNFESRLKKYRNDYGN